MSSECSLYLNFHKEVDLLFWSLGGQQNSNTSKKFIKEDFTNTRKRKVVQKKVDG